MRALLRLLARLLFGHRPRTDYDEEWDALDRDPDEGDRS